MASPLHIVFILALALASFVGKPLLVLYYIFGPSTLVCFTEFHTYSLRCYFLGLSSIGLSGVFLDVASFDMALILYFPTIACSQVCSLPLLVFVILWSREGKFVSIYLRWTLVGLSDSAFVPRSVLFLFAHL